MIIGGMTLGSKVPEQEGEEMIGSSVVIGALAGLYLEEAETGLFQIFMGTLFIMVYYCYVSDSLFSSLSTFPRLSCIINIVPGL